MFEPIVFIPGLLCTETLFAPQLAAFSDHPVMIADHRNHDSIDAMASALLKAAPERFALAGLSMGGYAALAVLRAAPERVSRLALLDTTARADTSEKSERRQFLIDLTGKKGFQKIPHLLYPGLVHETRENDQAMKDIVVEMAVETGPDAFIRQQTAIMNRVDARSHLGDVECPALILAGDGDTLTPPELSEEMHALIPDSTLAVIEGAGHLSTLEEPRQVTRQLADWMGRSNLRI